VKGLHIAYSPTLGFVERDKIDRDVAVAVENAVKVFAPWAPRWSRTRRPAGARPAQDPERALAVQRRHLGKEFQRRETRADGSRPAEGGRVGANLGQEAVVTAIHQRQQVGTIMNQFMASTTCC
jgi:hypothetical protein